MVQPRVCLADRRCAPGRTGGYRPARPGPDRARRSRPTTATAPWAGGCGRGPARPGRARWCRARSAAAYGAVAGVALLLGMQPVPGLHGHGAVLVVLADQGGGRGRPGGRVGAVELGTVAARPAALGGTRRWWRVGVEAAVRAQPYQHRHLLLGRVQGELGGVVAAVEDEERHGLAGGQPAKQRVDLRGGGWSVSSTGRRRASTGAVQESRAKPSCAIHWSAQPAMIGWPAEWREGW
jgi:hypothetical protein